MCIRDRMKRVGLEDQLKKKTGKYSRGMRQRLGLADVLIKLSLIHISFHIRDPVGSCA